MSFDYLNCSICFFFDLVKPLKISAYLDNFFFIASKGGPKEKNSKTKKAEKVQPNVLIGLFVHFPFQKARTKIEVVLSLPW